MSSLHPAPEPGVLDHIVAVKRIDVEHAKARLPVTYLEERVQHLPPTRGFKQALETSDGPAIIAEVKRAFAFERGTASRCEACGLFT